jgi:cyclophilin family peptidyl-prolyl cis-trans isomerase
VPSEKRERQKAGRAARQEAIRAAQKRRAARRRLMLLAIPAAIFAFLIGRALLSGDDSGGDTEVAATTDKAAPCPKENDQERRATFEAAQKDCIDENKTYVAKVSTDVGDFTVELDAKRAPTTVNNFVVLSRYHFYDGLTFHRVVKDFVIQGGDPAGNGQGGPGYKFADEVTPDLKYPAGSVAMANSGANTNGSQFFVVTSDGGPAATLPPNYTRFGTVTEGMDVVKKIEADAGEPPTTIHKINSITIEER